MKKYLVVILAYLCYLNISYANTNESLFPLDTFFHGSPNNNIEEIDTATEDSVFATPSIALASCYLFRWYDDWVNQIVLWKDNPNDYTITMVISDKDRFLKIDNGGSIYLLPRLGFNYNENKGLRIFEWVTNKKVIPYDKLEYVSALEAMKKYGVKVYFLDQEEWQNYKFFSEEQKKEYLDTKKPE